MQASSSVWKSFCTKVLNSVNVSPFLGGGVGVVEGSDFGALSISYETDVCNN